MKKNFTYKVVVLILLAFLSTSCVNTTKRMNKRVTLWRKDKIPYGTSVAFDHLKYIFPHAEINIDKKAPDIYEWQNDTATNLKTAYIIITPQFIPDNSERLILLNMAAAGCHVFISSLYVGELFLDSLHAKMNNESIFFRKDSLKTTIYNPLTRQPMSFVYPGYSYDNYFTKIDTSITSIDGTAKNGKANFIQFTYPSGGTVSIQIEPFAFTNFFLLHKNNIAYYNTIFSYLPENITSVEWDDYYRNKRSGRNNFSSLGFLLKQPSFKVAIILILLLCVLAVLAEAKRRQRIVPVIPPLHNSSLDFVKTIGRLYFQQKDHKNLAKKMIAHFLDHVRSRYNLSTSVMDDALIDKLSYKSGYDRQLLSDIIENIKMVEQASALSEADLFSLSKKLEQFYKNQS